MDFQCALLYEANHGSEERRVQPYFSVQLDFMIVVYRASRSQVTKLSRGPRPAVTFSAHRATMPNFDPKNTRLPKY